MASIRKMVCDVCGEEKKHEFPDGAFKCFGCDTYWKSPDAAEQWKERRESLLEGSFMELKKKGLSKAVCTKFGVVVAKDDNKRPVMVFPRIEEGVPVAQKLIDNDNNIDIRGPKGYSGLFGKHTCRGTGKMLVVTETEIDALSVSQCNDLKYDTCSLTSPVQFAYIDFARESEFLAGYERVVLMFNKGNDEHAIRAAETCIPGRAFIATLPEPSPHEMLLKRRFKEVGERAWAARVHSPVGIVVGKSVRERRKQQSAKGMIAEFPWPDVQATTRGVRETQVVTIGSGSGMGKSEIVGEICYSFREQGVKVGTMALEEGAARSLDRQVGFYLEERVYLLDDPESHPRYNEAWEALKLDDKPLYDSWGSMDGDVLINKMRGMRVALGCEVVILDHISIVVSGHDLTSDERRTIDNIMTKIRSLCEETGLCVIVVCHMNQPQGKPLEEGGVTSLKLLRGSRAIGQLSDLVIGLERNQQAECPIERATTLFRCLKNRWYGKTGPMGTARFNEQTGRIKSSDPADVFKDDIVPLEEEPEDLGSQFGV